MGGRRFVWWPLLALLLFLQVAPAARHGDDLRIAGIFEEDDIPDTRQAFLSAVEAINRQTASLRFLERVRRPLLTPVVITIKPGDSFGTGRKVCELMSEGVSGVVGPRQSASTDIVRSVCDTLEVPQVVANWDPEPHLPRAFQFNLHPDAKTMAQALVDVVQELKWRAYTILYQDDESLVRLQGVLQAREPTDPPITVRQLSGDGDYRPLLKEIKQSSESRIILDCETDMIIDVLKQAAEVKLMEIYQSYLITSLDAHTLDFTEFKASGTNITTLRLIHPGNEFVIKTMQDFEYTDQADAVQIKLETLRAETALTYDAVQVLAGALFNSGTIKPIRQQPLECAGGLVWDHGQSVQEFIRDRRPEGLSGQLAFNPEGSRVGFMLEVIEFSPGGFKLVGTWSPDSEHTDEGYTSSRSEAQTHEETQNLIQGRHLIVSSRIGPPYLKMKSKTNPPRVGNDRYEGYSMDLIADIAELLNFTFEFRLAADQAYGSYNDKTHTWNGLVGDLMYGRADLAICDLTITQDRQSAVDFTMPFMNLGISILYFKSAKVDPSLFSFLDPFTVDVWIYMATAYLGVSLTFFILARMAPGEWDKPHPCDPEPTELENTWTMLNIFWFSTGSLMCQGSDLLPKAVSTRLVAGMWWFFVLIMIASYTANLAAFLTLTRKEVTINSVEDLASQTKIKYGTYGSGSTASFFRRSNDSLYQRIWTVMKQARPDVFTANNDEGVDRVKKEKGNYAFFMESTTIEYQTALNCDLRKVGGMLDSKGYGIALPRDSPYRTAVSGAVLTLQERGNLSALKTRWWKAPDGQECPEDEEAVSSDELGILNVGGVFLVLVFGTLAAFFVAILEFLWNCRKIAVEEKITPWEAIVSELKFVVQLSNDEKPVRRKQDENASQINYGSLAGSK